MQSEVLLGTLQGGRHLTDCTTTTRAGMRVVAGCLPAGCPVVSRRGCVRDQCLQRHREINSTWIATLCARSYALCIEA